MHVPGPGLKATERGKVDDPATALASPGLPAQHEARRGLGAEKGPFQVDAQDSVPVPFTQLVPAPRKENPRIVHQEIEPAEPLLGGAKHRLNLPRPRDVGTDGHGPDTPSGDLTHGRAGLSLGTVVVHHYVR